MYTIKIVNENFQFSCINGESLSDSMHRVNNKHPIVGCRGGGCGVCKIKIISGKYDLGKMSIKYISLKDIGKGYSLACRTYPKSDMDIEFVGRK
ncbi:2Fe-2S iron-sulfur cluster-binding protein [Miniphocaeibacter massiliensis]|uniref:2Fe-2S iron-sulfur cluster-binding protein n=1 Tax=Miniphocaeibacter massiliensis TaxID=2041841 RepID=UPI000C07119B|nr:2Fe-2S iron-sulfur cluster-binding protein [Miniphocaeibacter massiliensis]